MENLIKINNTITWRDIENAEIINVEKLDELALNLTLAEYTHTILTIQIQA